MSGCVRKKGNWRDSERKDAKLLAVVYVLTVGEKGKAAGVDVDLGNQCKLCLLYTSPSPRDRQKSRMPSSA